MRYIINESQYKKFFLKEYFPGTKKPMGADGVDENVFKEILYLMKTTFGNQNGFQKTATDIETKGKLQTKEEKDVVAKAINLIHESCRANDEFNKERIINFCYEISEIIQSDSDNVFSKSYGITKTK